MPVRSFIMIAVLLYWGGPWQTAFGQEAGNGPGIKILSNGYEESWALLIGINYQVTDASRTLVPTLNNAENDAIELKKLLTRLYGYQEDHVILLTGSAEKELRATEENIKRELRNFRDDRIKPNHSVLVFFSGHGTRIDSESGESGAIYAADVSFNARGQLKGGHLRMHKDLISTLEGVPAKHKLVILDCCHSGEIFSQARPRSDVDDRLGENLFETSNSIQAMASCRDRQRASDGSGNNSPFTSTLLQALRRVPAKEGPARTRIGVNQLFTYMVPELKSLPNGQSPDCRLLHGPDGEFSFFPDTSPEAQAEFASNKTSPQEFRMLQAMVPGDHGNWWFEEMPWFIPSLRLMIIEKKEPDRSGLESSVISQDKLHELAEKFREQLNEDLRALEKSQLRARKLLVESQLDAMEGLNASKNSNRTPEQLPNGTAKSTTVKNEEHVKGSEKGVSQAGENVVGEKTREAGTNGDQAKKEFLDSHLDLNRTLKKGTTEHATALDLADTHEQSRRIMLLSLRRDQISSLLTKNVRDRQLAIAKIVSDLKPLAKETEAASEGNSLLSATDLHLLAVCQHYLFQHNKLRDDPAAQEAGASEVIRAYKDALEQFDKESSNQLALKALCYADYGYFLSSVTRDYKEAANQFQASLASFGPAIPVQKTDVVEKSAKEPAEGPVEGPIDNTSDAGVSESKPADLASTANDKKAVEKVSGNAPAAFRVFVLCSQAEALQRQNRWGQANDLLNTALHVARGFDSEHELMVFVMNRIAWAYMEQWRIQEAESYFTKANQILLRLARSEGNFARTESTDKKQAEEDAKPTSDAGEIAKQGNVSNETAPDEEANHQHDFEVMLGSDYQSLARYLHHLHGLAMTKRFNGQIPAAIVKFREIVQLITQAMDQLKQGQANFQASNDAERKLLDRLVNSQERLADCHLFGDPTHRDESEAADDYRRALNACAFLPAGDDRDGRRMSLLYKLALTLSLPSAVQDPELATMYCKEASLLRSRLKVPSNEVNGTLGDVTEAVVPFFAGADSGATASSVSAAAKEDPLDNLRKQIHKLRDEVQGDLHRDQLEVLLLASKVLVDRVPDTDRFHLAEDSELLLYLCRQILPRANGGPGVGERHQETNSYLRAYYDTVMFNKLRMKPRHVKDLIEIQWEATHGEFYTKAPVSGSVLALYILQDDCYLFLDIPGGASKYSNLKGSYYVTAVQKACTQTGFRLPLPDEIQQELAQLTKRNSAGVTLTTNSGVSKTKSSKDARKQSSMPLQLELRWNDPIRGIGTNTSEKSQLTDPTSGFPFSLPDEVDSQPQTLTYFTDHHIQDRKVSRVVPE